MEIINRYDIIYCFYYVCVEYKRKLLRRVIDSYVRFSKVWNQYTVSCFIYTCPTEM